MALSSERELEHRRVLLVQEQREPLHEAADSLRPKREPERVLGLGLDHPGSDAEREYLVPDLILPDVPVDGLLGGVLEDCLLDEGELVFVEDLGGEVEGQGRGDESLLDHFQLAG